MSSTLYFSEPMSLFNAATSRLQVVGAAVILPLQILFTVPGATRAALASSDCLMPSLTSVAFRLFVANLCFSCRLRD